MSTNGRPLWLACILLALAVTGRAEDDPREAHGTFTGAVKPLLYVTDVEKSAPFYRDVLGFEFQGFANTKGEPYYAEMVAGEQKFGLHEPVVASREALVGQQRLYFRVKDLDKHHARVVAWGGEAGEIKETPWMDMFIVKDPDGNEIVFAVTNPDRHTINPWNTRTETPPAEEGGN
jgi:predicted enzyme related to lactoylglutathione lyase